VRVLQRDEFVSGTRRLASKTLDILFLSTWSPTRLEHSSLIALLHLCILLEVCQNLLTLGTRGLEITDHVERTFWEIISFTGNDGLK